MGRSRQKRAPRRPLMLALFVLAGGIVFLGRYELLWAVKGYAGEGIDFLRILGPSDLPSRGLWRQWPAEVVGTPDYKNALGIPYGDDVLTCYRMVGFGNRLCVCTDKGLRRPEAIDEIIEKRVIRGRLEALEGHALEDRIRNAFLRAGGIRLSPGGVLLFEDPVPLPPLHTVGFLAGCLLLCFFFGYRFIKG